MSGDPMTGASAAETTSVPRHPRSLRWQRKEYGQQVVGVKLYSGVVGLPGDTPDERLVVIYDSDGKVRRQQHVVGVTMH